MYSTCLHCTRDLGRNAVLEELPIGRRVAFDSGQGRLWVICRHCTKWNLVPFDTRMEAIDDCERLFRDTRTRFSTDQIGLGRVREGLELVRIGEPLRPEFAAWRFGDTYRRRRRRQIGLSVFGGVAGGLAIGGAVAAGIGGAYLALSVGQALWDRAANARSQLRVLHPEHEAPLRWRVEEVAEAGLFWPADSAPVLTLPRPASWKRFGPRVDWEGPEVAAVGRRVLGRMNRFGGGRRDIAAAARLLGEHQGNLSTWLWDRATAQRSSLAGKGVLTGGSTPYYSWELRHRPLLLLQRLPTAERLAIEMWMSEDIERVWLEGELKLLEREWREAEELAGIADALALDAEDQKPGPELRA